MLPRVNKELVERTEGSSILMQPWPFRDLAFADCNVK